MTDVAGGELTGLDAVAARLADAYATRYGVAAAPGPDQAVAIFASDVRYRAFAEADGGALPGTRGHAGAGLAAFSVGRNPLETRVLLVHELTHLLSRNALGDGVPVWLDEGIAEDLAWCRTDAGRAPAARHVRRLRDSRTAAARRRRSSGPAHA